MAMVLKFIQTTLCLRATLRRDKSMGGAVESRQRVKCTRVASHLIRCVARDFTSGRMGDFISEIGREAKRMGKESTCGRMDRPMKVSSKATIAMASASCITQMASVLKAFGKMAKSTAKANTFGQMVPNTTSFMLTVLKRSRASSTELIFPSKL